MDFPGTPIPPLSLHTYGEYGPMWEMRNYLNATFSPGSLTWVSNLALYMPIHIPFTFTVKRAFWINGSTTGGNAQFGIYTPSGSQIYATPATVTTGGSSPQFVTPATPFQLSPGRYLFAMMFTGSTTAAYGSVNATADSLRLAGVTQEATGGTLPSTATFATASNALITWCGVTSTTTGT